MIRKAMRRMKWEIRSRVVRDLKQSFRDERASLPLFELGPDHIADTKLLANRQALLETLPKGARIVEAGVAAGGFSQDILDIARPAELHLIDAWHSERYNDDLMNGVKARFESAISAGQVIIHRGLSTEVVHTLPDGHFDFIYIDTAHTYDTTLEELQLFSRKLKPGGLLGGHDYIAGSFQAMMMYGVIAAVHRFCVEDGWKMKFLTVEQGVYPSFAIEKMEP